MFVLKKTHDSKVNHLTSLFDARGEVISNRDQTIGRLQRENARLLAEVSGPQEQKDEGATYVLKLLADALHVENWSIQSGSEEWEGDLWATMCSILVDAGVLEEDNHTFATHKAMAGLLRDKLVESERAKLAEQLVNSLMDEIKALKPDAEKHREKLRRDRAYVTSKRAQKVVLAA
jgi:hypothetical protein